MESDKKMLNINKIIIDLAVLTQEQAFNDSQKKELNDLINTIEQPSLIKPWALLKNMQKVERALNMYEVKYLEYGGDKSQLEKLKDDMIRDIKQTIPGIKQTEDIIKQLKRR